jgi:1,4-dihydroxy-2-naphthoate octaprenyltransferase
MKFGIGNETGLEQLRGASLTRAAKRMVLAPRPMFFPASIVPVLLGTAWGVREAGETDAVAFALALAATVLVHAAVNVVNDVYDDICGTDPINSGRVYPFTGGSRFIQSGILDRGAMRRLGLLLLAMAGVLGIVLAALKGAVVIALGLFGAALGVAYSATPLQLSARGLGELTVAIGFGVLPVMGAAWLQSGTFGLDSLLISLPLSFWVFNILLINEISDIKADAEVGKRTFPVRWGLRATWRLYLATNALALLSVVIAVAVGLLPILAIALPGLLVVVALYIALTLAQGTPARSTLATAIKSTLTIHAAGGLWLTFFAWP